MESENGKVLARKLLTERAGLVSGIYIFLLPHYGQDQIFQFSDALGNQAKSGSHQHP